MRLLPDSARLRRWIVGFAAAAGFFVMWLVFLHLSFPYAKLERRMIALAEAGTASGITVQEGGIRFPFGVAWHGVRIAPRPPAQSWVIDLDDVRCRLRLWPLLLWRIHLDLALRAYGGEAHGILKMDREAGTPRFTLEQQGEGFDLSLLRLAGGPRLQGRARFRLDQEWAGGDFFRGDGKATLELDGLRVAGLEGMGVALPLPELLFPRVTGRVTARSGLITLNDLVARGAQVDLTGSGTLVVRDPPPESLITLTVRVTPKEGLREQLAVLSGDPKRSVWDLVIRGPLSAPTYSLSGLGGR